MKLKQILINVLFSTIICVHMYTLSYGEIQDDVSDNMKSVPVSFEGPVYFDEFTNYVLPVYKYTSNWDKVVTVYNSFKITSADLVKSDGGIQTNIMIFIAYYSFIIRNVEQYNEQIFLKVAKRHLPKHVLERSKFIK